MAIRFGRGLRIEGRPVEEVIAESRARIKAKIEKEVENAAPKTSVADIAAKIENEIIPEIIKETAKATDSASFTSAPPPPPPPEPDTYRAIPVDMPGLGPYDPGYSGPLPSRVNKDGDQILPDGTIVSKDEDRTTFVTGSDYKSQVPEKAREIIESEIGKSTEEEINAVISNIGQDLEVPEAATGVQERKVFQDALDQAMETSIQNTLADSGEQERNTFLNALGYEDLATGPGTPAQATEGVPTASGFTGDGGTGGPGGGGTATPTPVVPTAVPKLQPFAQGGRWFKVTGYPGLTNAYFVEYDLPGGNTIAYFATREDLDKLHGIGPGVEPQFSGVVDYNQFRTQSGRYFGGEVEEVIGTLENYATRVERTLLSPEGDLLLPEWANNSPEMKDLFYIGVSESWSDDKFLREMAKTQAFQTRYPAYQDMLTLTGGNHEDALANYKAYEEQVRILNNRYGEEYDVTEIVKLGIQKGDTVEDLKATYDIFERAEKNAEALIAFQGIINATEGVDFNILDPQSIVSFFSGTAPTEIYDIYEASSISEQARKFNLDNLSVEEALEIAKNTPGQLTDQQISGALKTAAQTIARYRDYIDLGYYGLTLDDVTNASLGYTAAGGLTEMEIATAFGRILSTDENVKNLTSNISGSNFQKDRQIRSIG